MPGSDSPRRHRTLLWLPIFLVLIIGGAIVLRRMYRVPENDRKARHEEQPNAARFETDPWKSPSDSNSDRPSERRAPLQGVQPDKARSLDPVRASGPSEPPRNQTRDILKFPNEAPGAGPPPKPGRRVKGAVRLRGPAPSPQEMDLRSWPLCAQKYPEGMRSDHVVVDKDGGVRWALVYVVEGLDPQAFEVPKEPAALRLIDCRFAPHVTGVRALQELRIINADDQQHRVVQVRSDATSNHEWSLAPKASTGIRFSQASFYVVSFVCDLHPWERAWVGVSEHPFFAVTNEKGDYELPSLPPGRYTVAAWHERYASASRQIEVSEETDAAVDFELSRERK
jgi:carboxypeptidase family protein